MRKRRFKPDSESDPDTPVSPLDQALRNVRQVGAGDKPAPAKTKREADAEADSASEAELTGLPGLGLPTAEELAARADSTDAPDDSSSTPGGLKDPTDIPSGFQSARESLADKLAAHDPFAATDPGGSGSPGGKDTSMIAEEVVQTFPSGPVTTVTDDGEVKDTTAGDTTARDTLEDLPLVGGYFKKAFENAEDTKGTYEDRLDAASSADTPMDDGSDGGSAPPATSDTEDEGDSGVMHEFDADDGSHVTVYNDGTIITTYEDGSQAVSNPDGSEEHYDPDGNPVADSGEAETGGEDEGEGEGEDEDEAPPAGEQEDEGEDKDESEPDGTGEAKGEGDKSDEPEQGGGTEMSGDPDGAEGAPLPEDLQQQLGADLAAAVKQLRPVDPGDGATDPEDPNADPAFGAGAIEGVAVDPHAELRSMLGNPGGPGGPGDSFGSGAGEVPSAPPSQDPGFTDPAPDADAEVQTSGPEERDTGGELKPIVSSSDGSEDESEDDSTAAISSSVSGLVSKSPLGRLIDADLVPDDDTSGEPPDDADD